MTLDWTVALASVIGLLVTIVGYFWNRDNTRRDREISTLFRKAQKNDDEHRDFSASIIRFETKLDGVHEAVQKIESKINCNGDRR